MAPVRRKLERAVRTGFAPGLVGLMARGNNVDVTTVGRMAIAGLPVQCRHERAKHVRLPREPVIDQGEPGLGARRCKGSLQGSIR